LRISAYAAALMSTSLMIGFKWRSNWQTISTKWSFSS